MIQKPQNPTQITRYDGQIFAVGDLVQITKQYYNLKPGAIFEIAEIEPSLPKTIEISPGTIWFFKGKDQNLAWRGAPENCVSHARYMTAEEEFTLDEIHTAQQMLG